MEFEVSKQLMLQNGPTKMPERIMVPGNGFFTVEGKISDDEILGEDDDFDFPTVLTAYGHIFPADMCWEFADAISSDSELIAEAVCDKNGAIRERFCFYKNPLGDGCVIFIDRIEVPEKYRNVGVFDYFLTCLPYLVSEIDPSAIGAVLLASPYELLESGEESEEYISAQKRLIKGYERHGFKRTKKDSAIMYLTNNKF